LRRLSESFIESLLSSDGVLSPLLERIKRDDTLMLSIRDGYINVYYRGGNILKLEERNRGSYSAYFNREYNKFGEPEIDLPIIINAQDETKQWVDSLQALKGTMDMYLSAYPKPEREYQQIIARENNFSSVSNKTEYFVTDIEFADSDLSARLDILALRWLASERKSTNKFRLGLIEMKYGDGALGGKSGLLKHLEDFDSLLSDPRKCRALIETAESQFNQLDKLGLLNFNRIENWTDIKIDPEHKPEVIFVLANHNPRSTVLKSILEDPIVHSYANSEHFDLRFYVSGFAGYGLYHQNMFTLDEFLAMV